MYPRGILLSFSWLDEELEVAYLWIIILAQAYISCRDVHLSPKMCLRTLSPNSHRKSSRWVSSITWACQEVLEWPFFSLRAWLKKLAHASHLHLFRKVRIGTLSVFFFSDSCTLAVDVNKCPLVAMVASAPFLIFHWMTDITVPSVKGNFMVFVVFLSWRLNQVSTPVL